eukprot:1919999-Amphidinium_carterae.1
MQSLTVLTAPPVSGSSARRMELYSALLLRLVHQVKPVLRARAVHTPEGLKIDLLNVRRQPIPLFVLLYYGA